MSNDIEVMRPDGENTSSVPQVRALMRNHIEAVALFKILLINFLLTIVTLGIYRFWAKTRFRQYLWGHVEIMGDRLEYTGTGKELFLGFLFVFIVILMPLFVVSIGLEVALVDASDEAQVVRQILQLIVILFLIGMALFRARRYRLTRTHWRGIYGNQSGSAVTYALMTLGCMVLSGVSLGLAAPLCSVWLTKYEMGHTWLGDERPTFTPKATKLYGAYLVFWLGSIVYLGCVMAAIGVSNMRAGDGVEPVPEMIAVYIVLFYLSLIPLALLYAWYQGKKLHHFVSSTRFHNHDLSSAISGVNFLGLTVGNMLLKVLTLGLGTAWVYKRSFAFLERNVGLLGNGDFTALHQSQMSKPQTGEGLADAFDVGAI
ncbi:YjgN family protein [Magnetovibrio blakemorei]|uniref:DUF898 domain-containing protein n=1 Tax=Magnetovibrio blakemorei TaxID=28181 RepID=A0A1E5Q732_9PROT|nr:YjgN family protein [Magnetovibrio blakemorei]OEJ66745.1 hypothetical protein BEN30_11760 [Magnetovibrio blakemorei]